MDFPLILPAGGDGSQPTVMQSGNGKPAYSSPHQDPKTQLTSVKVDPASQDNRAKYSPSVKKSNVPKDNKSTYVTASELRSHQEQLGEIEKAPL